MNSTANLHRAPMLALGWGVVAALAVVITWGGGISMDLMLLVMSIADFFSDDRVLAMKPDWGGMALRVAATAAIVVLIRRLVRFRRVSKGACGRCGRDGSESRDYRQAAQWAAVLSIIPAAGYAALKTHWSFGGTIGLADEDVFAGIEPWSPGFGDTAVMAVIGIAVAVAMATRWPRLPRWLLLAPALIGCAMLLPVAVLGNIINLANVAGIGPGGIGPGTDPILQPWVGWFVYGCFAVWGAGLAIVTVEYLYGTRRTCRACGRG